MNKRSGSDISVVDRLRVRNMKLSSATCDGLVERQDTTLKNVQNDRLKPKPEHCASPWIAPLGEQDADFEFMNGNSGNKQLGSIQYFSPTGEIWVSFAWLYLAKFGNHVGIKQEDQDRSTNPARSVRAGISRSISSTPGIASKSTMLRGLPESR